MHDNFPLMGGNRNFLSKTLNSTFASQKTIIDVVKLKSLNPAIKKLRFSKLLSFKTIHKLLFWQLMTKRLLDFQ